MSSQPKTFLTPEQYLEIERKAAFKSEYYNGEMFAMAGGTPRQAFIIANLSYEFVRQLRGRCRVGTSDLRLRVLPSGLYTYPDVMVICGPLKYADEQKDTLLNPSVIVEVLSDSTRDYDLGRKFQFYRSLPSLHHYLMVDQDSAHIVHWTRQEENLGTLAEFTDLSQSIRLTSIDCVLSLADVYKEIDLSSPIDV